MFEQLHKQGAICVVFLFNYLNNFYRRMYLCYIYVNMDFLKGMTKF